MSIQEIFFFRCQDMFSRTITRLGQEITLADDKNDFRTLDDLDNL